MKWERESKPTPSPRADVERGPIFVTCPECGAEQLAAPWYWGRSVLCETCGRVYDVVTHRAGALTGVLT